MLGRLSANLQNPTDWITMQSVMDMKKLLIGACLLHAPVCFAQQVEIAASLSPEDLGAYKWVFTGTAPKDSVIVFRVTTVREWSGGKVETRIYDTVHYSPGKEQSASVFFIDPHYFDRNDEEPVWHFRALGGTGSIPGRYVSSSYGGNKGEINFVSEKWGKTKKIFEAFVKSYDDAVLLYGDLPSIVPNIGWSWAGSPKTQSEQDGGGQPATRSESK